MSQQLPTSNILLRVYNSFNAGLNQIMTDIPTFLDFSAKGTWSSPEFVQASALKSSTPSIGLALLTYVVSETLAQNDFSIIPLATSRAVDFVPLTNAQRKAHWNGENILRGQGKQTLYWSPNTSRQYQLTWNGGKLANGSTIDPFNVLTQIEDNGWADLPTLFDGAYNCTLEGKAGGPVVNLGDDGSLDLSCLSAVPVVLAKGVNCPVGAVNVDEKCPFKTSV